MQPAHPYYNPIPVIQTQSAFGNYQSPYAQGPGGYPVPTPLPVRPQITPYNPNYNLPTALNGPIVSEPPVFPTQKPSAAPAMPKPHQLIRPHTPGTKSNPLPRKSAMKNGGTRKPSDGAENAPPLTRSRTISVPRPGSNSATVPHHIFMSFKGSNEFLLDNVPSPVALEEIKHEIFPLWDVEFDDFQAGAWRVKFRGHPWSGVGADAHAAYRIITAIFKLLAKRGYHYLTSINTGSSSHRLAFIVATTDESANFFAATFSDSGHRLTLVHPPPIVIHTIGSALKNSMPRNMLEGGEEAGEDGILVLDLRRSGSQGSTVDKTLFMTHVLKQLHLLGYKLEAGIPLAKTGLLGLGKRKEVLVFRGSSS